MRGGFGGNKPAEPFVGSGSHRPPSPGPGCPGSVGLCRHLIGWAFRSAVSCIISKLPAVLLYYQTTKCMQTIRQWGNYTALSLSAPHLIKCKIDIAAPALNFPICTVSRVQQNLHYAVQPGEIAPNVNSVGPLTNLLRRLYSISGFAEVGVRLGVAQKTHTRGRLPTQRCNSTTMRRLAVKLMSSFGVVVKAQPLPCLRTLVDVHQIKCLTHQRRK